MSERFWKFVEQVIQAFYPGLLLLRLADKKSPAMDKLYFYVRQMDNTMTNSKALLNLMEHKIQQVDDEDTNIAAKMIRYFLKSDVDQRVLAWTFDREDMSGLDTTKNDTIPYENDSEDDDDGDDDPGDLEDDGSESSRASEVVNEPEEDVNLFKLGDHMVAAWKKRSERLRTDISIAGWMCSSDPLVMKDVNDNHRGNHRHAVNKLLQKWYMHEVQYNDIKMGELINCFWQEFEEFQSKTGSYANREYIFRNHIDLTNGNIHFWHKKESLRFTSVFGRFACRVCSKILGIGSAERSWGDVKHLKTNRRSHLSSRATKMQATIFGASCVELARIKNKEKYIGNGAGPCKLWREDDFILGGTDGEVNISTTPPRYFRAWLEDWEINAIKKQDVVNETRLLAKYGGLQWRDPDNGYKKLISDRNELHWSRPTKKNGGGYGVIAYDEHYREDDPNNTDHVEPWIVTIDLIECISHFYKNNRTEENVKVIEKEMDDDNEESVEAEEVVDEEAAFY
jgi:hypothetical protein